MEPAAVVIASGSTTPCRQELPLGRTDTRAGSRIGLMRSEPGLINHNSTKANWHARASSTARKGSGDDCTFFRSAQQFEQRFCTFFRRSRILAGNQIAVGQDV